MKTGINHMEKPMRFFDIKLPTPSQLSPKPNNSEVVKTLKEEFEEKLNGLTSNCFYLVELDKKMNNLIDWDCSEEHEEVIKVSDEIKIIEENIEELKKELIEFIN